MNAINDYLDGLLEGPSGLTNAVSRLAPIMGRDSLEMGTRPKRFLSKVSFHMLTMYAKT